MQSDVIIIGAGLSGLRLASLLADRGGDFLVIEARGKVGGRVLSETIAGAGFDLGPAWFWPGQPRIAALVQALGLPVFDQYCDGALSYEDERGQVQRGRGWASMQGSYRIEGGVAALTQRLADRLPAERLLLNHAVTGLTYAQGGVHVATSRGVIKAQRVVLALPPRLAAQWNFAPALPAAVLAAMQGVATWMAGQAKAVAVYDRAFWREAGLSGDATSRIGPMVEVHDASPLQLAPAALFGFIGVPPEGRRDVEALRQAVIAQLVRLFGPSAADPVALWVKDWASDPFTATVLDQRPALSHPDGRPLEALRGFWDGRLLASGSETAKTFAGYLEGALEAAEASFASLQKPL